MRKRVAYKPQELGVTMTLLFEEKPVTGQQIITAMQQCAVACEQNGEYIDDKELVCLEQSSAYPYRNAKIVVTSEVNPNYLEKPWTNPYIDADATYTALAVVSISGGTLTVGYGIEQVREAAKKLRDDLSAILIERQ